jgi:hypothetical protein
MNFTIANNQITGDSVSSGGSMNGIETTSSGDFSPGDMRNATIVNNVVTRFGSRALSLSSYHDNLTVDGNVCAECDEEGIVMKGRFDIVCSNNTVQNVCQASDDTRDAIAVVNVTGSSVYCVTNCMVMGNLISSDAANKHRHGIQLGGGTLGLTLGEGVVATNNTVRDSQTADIRVDNGNPLVADNVLLGDTKVVVTAGSPVVKGNIDASGSKGADLASTTDLTVPHFGDSFDLTGTSTVNTMAASWAGRIVTFQFDSTATVNDNAAGGIVMGTNHTGSAGDTLQLVFMGSSWFEISRSNN